MPSTLKLGSKKYDVRVSSPKFSIARPGYRSPQRQDKPLGSRLSNSPKSPMFKCTSKPTPSQQ